MMKFMKLNDLMVEYKIPEGEEIDMMPFTNWYLWENICFTTFNYAYEYELNDKYALICNSIPNQNTIDNFFKGYKVVDGEIIEKEEREE